MRPRIIAVLNCYAAAGANACQVAIYSDGSTKFFGDESLAKTPLTTLRGVDLRRSGGNRKRK